MWSGRNKDGEKETMIKMNPHKRKKEEKMWNEDYGKKETKET